MKKSISHVQGKGSLAHNNREFITNNVDRNRIKDNVIFKQESIAEAYHKLFDGAVAEFNAKQKRADRKKKESYFEDLFNRPPCQTVLTAANKEKSFYEDVVQIGLREDTGVGTKDAAAAKECLTEYMNGFQERNPQFYVFNAVMHMDEATPHLHIDYIPVATGYKNGLAVRNGIAKALEQMGYGKNKDAISKWRDSERQVLRSICERHGIEISEEQKDIDRKYLSVPEYKSMKAQAEILSQEVEMQQKQYEELSREIKPLCEVKEKLKAVEEWGKASTFNKNKVIMKKEEYEKLKNGYEMAILHKDKLKAAGEELKRSGTEKEEINREKNEILQKAKEILRSAERERGEIAAEERSRIQASMRKAVEQKETALRAAQEERRKAEEARAEIEKRIERIGEREKERIRSQMREEQKRIEKAREEAEKNKEETEKLKEQANKKNEELQAALTETHEKARELRSELGGIGILRGENKLLRERVRVLTEDITKTKEKYEQKIEDYQTENTELKKEVKKYKDLFIKAMMRLVSIGNVLKNLLTGTGKNEKYTAELKEPQRELIEAAETFSEDLIDYVPDEQKKRNMKEIRRTGVLNPIFEERMEENRMKKEQEQYCSYGMTR